MAVSAERGRATRERLQQAAIAVIAEAGWGNVTTRMVAERAGVNPALVHYHYASVSDLLVAASATFIERMLGEVTERLTEQPDVDQGLDWLLTEIGRYSGEDPVSLLVIEAFLASSRQPELRERLTASVIEFRTAVAAWLRAAGHGDAADAAATLLAAAIDGVVLHRALDPAIDLDALAGPLRAMLTAGRPGRTGTKRKERRQ